MKKRVFRILLSLIMAIVLTLSATLPAWAFAITSTSSSDPGTENARISYENGILRIGLNPETLDRMLDDGKITKAELMEFLPEAIRDLIHDRDTITRDDIRQILTAYVGAAELKEILADLPTDVILDYVDFSAYLDVVPVDTVLELLDVVAFLNSVDQTAFADLMANVDITLLLKDSVLEPILQDPSFKDILKDPELCEIINNDSEIRDRLVAIVPDEIKYELYLEGYTSVEQAFADPAKIAEIIGDSRISLSDAVDAIGYDVLRDFVDVRDVVDHFGGYEQFLNLYPVSELKTMFNQIGVRRVVEFLKDNGYLTTEKMVTVGKKVAAYAKSHTDDIKKLAKMMAKDVYGFLMQKVDKIAINDKTVFEAPERQFDLTVALAAVLQAIPDVEDLIAVGKDGTIAALNCGIEIEGVTYTYGVEFYWIGDPAGLNARFANHVDAFRLNVDDNLNVSLDLKVPAIAGAVWEKLLTTDRLPQSVREKMLNAPNLSLDDLHDFLEGLTDEQIEKIAQVISENLDKIKDKVYSKLGYNPNARSGGNVDAVISRVEPYLDRLTDPAVLNKIRNKAVGVVGAHKERRQAR